VKRHPTDLVSLVSGAVLLAVVLVYSIASSLNDLSGGWVVAAVLLLVALPGAADAHHSNLLLLAAAGGHDGLLTAMLARHHRLSL